MAILNLTQHPASNEQLEAGVVPLHEYEGVAEQPADELRRLLTFDDLPSGEEVVKRAEKIAQLADWSAYLQSGYDDQSVDSAMIGGAPFLMGPLAEALKAKGITPMFAFSRRESVETTKEDGAVVKTAVFRHLGFVKG